ncbi:MAG: substrate-binding domain-containing protein [Succinivibrio sp.]|nr:substrate-binding domain-containing protein [Succinivibrio sp.]
MLHPNLKLMLFSASLLLSSSSTLAENFPDKIQYFIRTTGDTFMSYVQHAFVKKAQTLDITVDTYDAADDAEEQFEQFSEDSRSSIPVVIDLVNPSACPKYIRHAEELKTTVIFINRAPEAEQILKARNAWYVGSISEESGIFQAQMIINYLKQNPGYDLNGNQTLDIMLLRGPEGHQDAVNRSSKVLEALNQAGIKYKLIYDLTCNWSFEIAFAETTKILRSKNEQKIDMVISNNDDMALGVINAFLENNRNAKLPPVFGVDAIPDALDAIADGTMTGTIKQDPQKMGETALAIANGEMNYQKLSEIAGTKVDSHFIRIPYQTITKE